MTEKQKEELAITRIVEELTPKYVFCPTGNPADFAVVLRVRPNWLTRLTQRLVLGFRYIPIDKLTGKYIPMDKIKNTQHI
jgi:hypothetical protein